MKVTYLEHSGFFVETERAALLFDYYQGEIPPLPAGKPLAVFISHVHYDHYNPAVFALAEQASEVWFLVSSDVPVQEQTEEYEKRGVALRERILTVEPDRTYGVALQDELNMEVTTLRSTDEGVAFLVSLEGQTIYHAGDLNLWMWEGEPEDYNQAMQKSYLQELSKLSGKKIDVAFVPLDSRQEGYAFGGMEYFLDRTESDCVFPMHLWGKYEWIPMFLEQHPQHRSRVRILSRPGETFELNRNQV